MKGVSKASLRGKRFKERMEVMREAARKRTERTVSVTPANDDLRRVLRHPHAGGFPESGGAQWPFDRFTERRIADGDIAVEEKAKEKAEQNGEQARSD